jgi:hypothetical protein
VAAVEATTARERNIPTLPGTMGLGRGTEGKQTDTMDHVGKRLRENQIHGAVKMGSTQSRKELRDM